MKTTNNITKHSKFLVSAMSLAMVIPALAIENPVEHNNLKEKEQKQQKEIKPKEGQERNQKKIAMIGLGGTPASDTLASHLGLEEGLGLTIYHVIPGSAAAKAGLQEHDVLTEFDGKKIGSQQDLRDAVTARKPGDEVKVKFIHKGKAEEKQVVLGERSEIPHMVPGGGINPWFQGMGNIPDVDRNRMQEEMKKHIERMRRQIEQQGGMQMDFGKLLGDDIQPIKPIPNELPGKNGKIQKFGFNAASSVTMMDAHGSITMKTINGKKEVTVKDKAGKVLFEGPYETEQDKAAVPDEIRDRLDRLNIAGNGKNGFRLQILPGGAVPPPAELDEDEAAE